MADETLHVDKNPCATCPYRCDTPAGVWEAIEYEKLAGYDDDAPDPALGVFLCHHSATTDRQTVCRGWLSVHAESVAARLAVLTGKIDDDVRYLPITVDVYPDGKTAAEAGLSGVEEPGPDAQRAIAKLIARRQVERRRRTS